METKLWKEMLFLFLPFVIFIAVSLMAACGGSMSRNARQFKNEATQSDDPFFELRVSDEEATSDTERRL